MRIPKSICALASVCDSESARYAMSAVLFGRDKKKPFAVATDGRRLVHATWDEESLLEFPDEHAGQVKEVLVHCKAVKELALLCNGSKGSDKKRVYLDEAAAEKVSARFNEADIRRELETKPVEGRFPAWKDMLSCPGSKSLASLQISGSLLLSTLKAVVSALECEGAQGVTLEIMGDGESPASMLRIAGEQNGKAIVAVQMCVES